MVEMMTSMLGGAHVGPEHRPWADTSKPSNTVSISFLSLNMGILDGVGVVFIKDSKKSWLCPMILRLICLYYTC